MKRNKLFILGICTVMVALVSLSLVSGTWARYTSQVSGEDSARVARWGFTVTDKSYGYNGGAVSQKFNFNLFGTVNEADTTTTEEHIAATDGTIIAPGTGGSFDLVLTNNSEVTAEYSIDYTVTNSSSIPVEFSVDGSTWGALQDVTASDATKLAHTNGSTTVTVYWRWPIGAESANAGDTALGIGGTAEIKVEAQVTFTQVD